MEHSGACIAKRWVKYFAKLQLPQNPYCNNELFHRWRALVPAIHNYYGSKFLAFSHFNLDVTLYMSLIIFFHKASALVRLCRLAYQPPPPTPSATKKKPKTKNQKTMALESIFQFRIAFIFMSNVVVVLVIAWLLDIKMFYVCLLVVCVLYTVLFLMHNHLTYAHTHTHSHTHKWIKCRKNSMEALGT